MSRRLILAAHADDETIGCGATIAKYANSGVEHFVGVLSRDSDNALYETRKAEAEAAWRVLGVGAGAWAGLREHPLPRDRCAVDAIAGWLREFQPDLVIVPHPGEKDRDHAAVAGLVHDAMAVAGRWPATLGYEVWTPLQEVHVIEAVDDTIDRKVEAIRCYQSQLTTIAYDDAAASLGRYRGIMTGRGEHAEVFTVIGR